MTSHSPTHAPGSPSVLLYSEPTGAFKNICRKPSLGHAMFVFMDAITCHLFKERKRKRIIFTLAYMCLLQRTLNKHVNYAVAVTPE